MLLPLFRLLRFRLYDFVEAAAFRSIVLRYAGAPIIATRVFFFFSFCLFGDVAFFDYFFALLLFSLINSMESTS